MSQLLITIPAALIAITFHEFSHGYAAYLLGDKTAKYQGRLTLNPIKHIDPIGLLCMIVAGVGWAKPVPVNPNNFKRPKWGMALSALAGPASNMLLAFVLLLICIPILVFTENTFLHALGGFLQQTAILSIGLGVFNMIPVPPLDGSKVLTPFLPDRALRFFYRFEGYIRFALLMAIFLGLFNGVIGVGLNWIYAHILDLCLKIFQLTGLL